MEICQNRVHEWAICGPDFEVSVISHGLSMYGVPVRSLIPHNRYG